MIVVSHGIDIFDSISRIASEHKKHEAFHTSIFRFPVLRLNFNTISETRPSEPVVADKS